MFTRLVNRGDAAVIKIGENIQITVVKIKGNQVKLDIDALAEVEVWRRELWDAKQTETEQLNRS